MKIRLPKDYRSADGVSIAPGEYDIKDKALHGKGRYLVETRHAEVIEVDEPEVTPQESDEDEKQQKWTVTPHAQKALEDAGFEPVDVLPDGGHIGVDDVRDFLAALEADPEDSTDEDDSEDE
jgi:hypothetical protein